MEVEFLGEYHLTRKQARGQVRPHHLDLSRQRTGTNAFPATVRHVNAAGPQVKIELAAETGEPVRVEMPHDRFSSLELQIGELVFVSAREVSLFVDDYSI